MSAEVKQFLVYRLDAFQSLISNNLSKTKFDRTLLDIAKRPSFIRASSKVSPEGPLTSIKQLKSLASSLKHGRRHTLLTADEQIMMIQHLSRLDYLLELKSYFHDRIYAFILKITSQWQPIVENVQKSKMADNSRKCVEYDLTKENGCSLTEEDVKMITEFVNKINDIQSRWTKMTDSSELDLAFFEDETREVILTQKEISPAELICYLIPDMTKKIKKSVELSKKWLEVISLKENNQNTFTGIDNRQKITETSNKILKIDENILADEKRARRLQTELKRLANKEDRYVVLKDDYETTAEKLEQVCSDYRNAVLERHSLNRKIQKEPGFCEEAKEMKKLDDVGDRIEASHKDMKMLRYSFALLQEDMALEAGMRSSYIRFEENVKAMLSKLELQIGEKKQKKRKLEKELILLKANSKWFESQYGKEYTEYPFEEVEEFREKRNNEKHYSDNIYISVGVENEESRLTSSSHKLTETDRNGTLSRIPILKNNFPKTSQSMHTRVHLPVEQNSKQKERGSNQRSTRIPKLVQ